MTVQQSQQQQSIVELKGITKRYGDFTAIDGLDLSIEEGEFLSIIGPSGCGKTTTLRMIGGFLEPTEGQVLIKGEDVTNLDASRHDTCMVFQDYALFPHMSVLDNVAFGLKMAKVPKAEREKQALEALALVGLADFGKRRPSQLSGGQRQRVALARAIVMNPSILLLDEPLGALDAQIRRLMQIELKKLQRQLQCTFIYVTHDQEEAMTMSDRILILRDGVICQMGTPKDLYENPSSLFAAKFLGDCSVIRGTFDGNAVLAPGLGTIRGRLTSEAFTGDAAVCVRPEKLWIGRTLTAENPGFAHEGVVDNVIFKGLSTRVSVDCAGHPMVGEIPGRTDVKEGEKVYVSFAPEDAVIVPYEEIDVTALVSQGDEA